MNRRAIFPLALLPALAMQTGAGMPAEQRVTAGEMVFGWWHRDARLHGRLCAPGPGWLAVGFNTGRELRATRFVIAAVAPPDVRAEVRVALAPGHRRIEELGGRGDLRDVAGLVRGGRSRVRFSLPHRATDAHAVPLSPGSPVYLMLAWSHSPDFDHHSAFREHLELVL